MQCVQIVFTHSSATGRTDRARQGAWGSRVCIRGRSFIHCAARCDCCRSSREVGNAVLGGRQRLRCFARWASTILASAARQHVHALEPEVQRTIGKCQCVCVCVCVCVNFCVVRVALMLSPVKMASFGGAISYTWRVFTLSPARGKSTLTNRQDRTLCRGEGVTVGLTEGVNFASSCQGLLKTGLSGLRKRGHRSASRNRSSGPSVRLCTGPGLVGPFLSSWKISFGTIWNEVTAMVLLPVCACISNGFV